VTLESSPDRNDKLTMTDDTGRNGDGANPFGSLKINFGAPAAPTTPATPAGSAATQAGGAASPTGASRLNPFGGGIAIISDSAADAAPMSGGPAEPAAREGRTESHVLIIGSGPAGLTAAIYAARANLEPIVLAGSAAGGQLMLTSEVENYPGFPDGIEGPDLMAKFRAQAARFGTHIVDVDIDRVDFSARPFRVWARGAEYRGETVIIATGASALWLEIESEQRLRGRGVSACATCDGFFFRDREIAVVGGGDSAMEEANYLTRFASKVHLLHRRDGFRASKIMIDRIYGNPKIEVHTNTAVDEVLGSAKVEGLRLRDTQSGDLREMPIEGLFIAIGHKPNTDVFRDWVETDEKGYLVAHEHTASRIPGVFIAGDVQDHRYRQAVTAAGDGARAAIDAERWLESEGIAERSTATAW
jgi:thioredoxin reductase (NADPH)